MPPLTQIDDAVSNTPAQQTSPDQADQTPTASDPQPAMQPATAAQTPGQPTTATQDAQTRPTQPQPSQTPPQTTQARQQSSQPTQGMVSNPPAQTTDPHANNPLVKAASVMRSVAETLAGPPRYTTTIDANTGTATRTKVPLSRSDIALSIALTALSGSLAGLSQSGSAAAGKAGVAGIAQGQQIAAQRRQQQQQQDAQAQADAARQSAAYSQKAAIADLNSRILLSTAEAEGRGIDNLSKIIATNKSLIDSYEDSGALDGRNVTQQELIEGMQGPNPRYSSTDQIGPIDGYRLLGNGQVEATHAVIKNPAAPVPLTQDMWDDFAANHVQGFPKGTKVGDGVTVPGYQIARANEQKTMFQLAQARHNEVANALSESDDPKVKALASQVPSIASLLDDPKTGAGLATALNRFQSWVSHADISHGGRDLYESLQAMAQPSIPDPTDPRQSIPNGAAKYAPQIAQAFGGWDVLKAYHDEVSPLELHSSAEAADMIASSEPGSRSAKYAQRFLDTLTRQAGAEAGAKESAETRADSSAIKLTSGSLTTPDALGFSPTVTDPKEASKRFASFKKNLDSLSQTDQSYKQFQQGLAAINNGDWNGAQSVVDLFSAIGLSAAPLAGKGFRVNQNVIAEHQHARGWEGELQAKLEGAQTGAIITPQQLQQYAGIAQQARANQYIATVNEMHNAGLPADAALPTGNGQRIDPETVRVFLALTGGNKDKARQAAIAKGWQF